MLKNMFNRINYSDITVVCDYCGYIHKHPDIHNIVTVDGQTILICKACGWHIVLEDNPIPKLDILKGAK